MKLTAYSRNRIYETLAHWNVPKDFADPFYNYLVYGFEPGSCFTSILANDFYGAIQRSHPANTVEAFKALSGWIYETMPQDAYGSYNSVSHWCGLTPNERRTILEKKGLIFTEEDEVWMTLQNKPSIEPMLW